MNRFWRTALPLILWTAANSAVLFEVKDNAGKIIMEVSDDGVRFFNPQYIPLQAEKDTLMVISATNIKALVRKGSSGSSSRDFDIAETGNVRKDNTASRLFKADDEGIKTYVGSEDSEGLARSFEVVTSTSNSSIDKKKFSIDLNTPDEVNDSTMLWYPKKNAFRVGHVIIPHPDSVGQASFATGNKCVARGKFSTAIGHNAQATGNSSFAIGVDVRAKGGISTAMGHSTVASGSASTAMGINTIASKIASTATGLYTTASGDASASFGNYTTAYGNNSIAMGSNTIASAFSSVVLGQNNIEEGNNTVWIETDPLFVIGNGIGFMDRSNAFEVKKNGNTYIPSLYSTTSTNAKKTVLVDNQGKLCVMSAKDDDSNNADIEQLQNENNDLKTKILALNKITSKQEERIAKLEATLILLLDNKK